jgi:hypothetical protein
MRIPIFYSYSHKDETYKEALQTHLSILKKQGYLEGWSDRRIAPGEKWEEEINLNLQKAKIVLLLVSSHFLASDYCYDTETIFALEQHERKHCVVIPIILKPCLWLMSHFKHLQALPKNGKPITTWKNKDEAWLNVSEGILKAIETLKAEELSAGAAKKESDFNSKSKSGEIWVCSNNKTHWFTAEDAEKSNYFCTICPIYEAILIKSESAASPTAEPSMSESTVSPAAVLNKPQQPVNNNNLKTSNKLSSLLIVFLKTYSSFYFSPLRIQKWGSRQVGFKELEDYDIASIKYELESLLNSNKLKMTKSKKGNIIYKIK